MSLTRDHINAIVAARRPARRMRNYPEGDSRFWAVIEGAYAAFCVLAVVWLVVRLFA